MVEPNWKEINEKKAKDILKGQCLNIAGRIYSENCDKFLDKAILTSKIAEMSLELYDTLMEKGFLEERKKPVKQDPKTTSELTCGRCGAKISEKVADYSMKKYNAKLCMSCQNMDKNG